MTNKHWRSCMSILPLTGKAHFQCIYFTTFIFLPVEGMTRKSIDKKVRVEPPVIFPDILDHSHC